MLCDQDGIPHMWYKQFFSILVFLSVLPNSHAMEHEIVEQINSLSSLYNNSGKELFTEYQRELEKNTNPVKTIAQICREYIKNISLFLESPISNDNNYILEEEKIVITQNLNDLSDCTEYFSNVIATRLCLYIGQMKDTRQEQLERAHLECSAAFFTELLKNRHMNYLLTSSNLVQSILYCDINYLMKVYNQTTAQSRNSLNDLSLAISVKHISRTQAKHNNINTNKISLKQLGLKTSFKSSVITNIINELVPLEIFEKGETESQQLESMTRYAQALRLLTELSLEQLLSYLKSKTEDQNKIKLAKEIPTLTKSAVDQFLERLNNLSNTLNQSK